MWHTEGSSQARGRIKAAATGLHCSHSNARSLTHWAKPGIEPTSSWILVEFVTAEPQEGLRQVWFFRSNILKLDSLWHSFLSNWVKPDEVISVFIKFSLMKLGIFICCFFTDVCMTLGFWGRVALGSLLAPAILFHRRRLLACQPLPGKALLLSKGTGLHGKQPVVKKTLTHFPQISYFSLGKLVHLLLFHYRRLWRLCLWRYLVSNRISLWCRENTGGGSGRGYAWVHCLSQHKITRGQAPVLLRCQLLQLRLPEAGVIWLYKPYLSRLCYFRRISIFIRFTNPDCLNFPWMIFHLVWSSYSDFSFINLFFSFFGHPTAYGVPGPGIRAKPQFWPKPQLW